MEKSPLRVIFLLSLASLLTTSVGKTFDCSRFTRDLQNDELSLKEVRVQLADNPALQVDLE